MLDSNLIKRMAKMAEKKFTSALQLHGFSKGAALMLVPNHQPKSSPNVSKAA